MREVNLLSTGKVWENRDFPYSSRNHEISCNSQCLRMYKFPENGNILWKATSFPGCGFLRKLEVIMKPK